MAPGARLVNLRAMGPDGSGATSSVIEAIDWAVDHRAEYNIRIINMSLGHPVLEAAATIRCARLCSGRSTRASWWWRRRATTGKRRTACRSSAASCRRATRRRH